jgi:hypothetical protein
MQMSIKQRGRIGWPTILGLGAVVLSMTVLALCMTATGTARFMAPMGYDVKVGYGVGATLELAKEVLPVAVLALWARQARGLVLALGAAWLCVVIFSSLATHATVMTAISSTERMGTWKMEVRTNSKTELASIEQQLAALSQPAPPRPAKTVQEALAAERVPPSVWQDSQECGRIQEGAHFARACAQVVHLRRELAAALDYERLSSRATELRKGLAAVPIVATADPLPAAFRATLGRVLPIGGTEGVALLITTVVELISGFGLAGIGALRRERSGRPVRGAAAPPSLDVASAARGSTLRYRRRWFSTQKVATSAKLVLVPYAIRAAQPAVAPFEHARSSVNEASSLRMSHTFCATITMVSHCWVWAYNGKYTEDTSWLHCCVQLERRHLDLRSPL